jgi:hypothetical protein
LAFIASLRAPSLIHRFIAGLCAVNGAGCGNRSMRAATEHQPMRSKQAWSIASSCRGKIFFAISFVCHGNEQGRTGQSMLASSKS